MGFNVLQCLCSNQVFADLKISQDPLGSIDVDFPPSTVIDLGGGATAVSTSQFTQCKKWLNPIHHLWLCILQPSCNKKSNKCGHSIKDASIISLSGLVKKIVCIQPKSVLGIHLICSGSNGLPGQLSALSVIYSWQVKHSKLIESILLSYHWVFFTFSFFITLDQ